MRILYAIQGTGNGHLSRATDIVPALRQYGDVDILVSGKNSQVAIPFDIRYRLSGLSFVIVKKADIEFDETFTQANLKKLWNEIRNLPVWEYGLVINDFEPASAWASRLRNVPCYSLSHQAAVSNKRSPKPEIRDFVGKTILKQYAPTRRSFGFHFEAYDTTIFTPVIRHQVRRMEITNDGHYTVYLPAYSDETLVRKLSWFENVRWEIFSKHCQKPYQKGNCSVERINNEAFVKSMASSEGILCGAGFETPAEALFLGKKLMVVPMKSQDEQQCNAASLKRMGVPVLKNLKKKRLHKIAEWIESDHRIEVDYPDCTVEIVNLLIETHLTENPQLIVSHLSKL